MPKAPAKKKPVAKPKRGSALKQKPQNLAGGDFLNLAGYSAETLLALFKTAAAIKKNNKPFRKALDGVTAILLFEKASLRTRITFETGINLMGGTAIYMDHSAQKLGERESVKDYGKNLERWVQCIVARVYSQTVVDELADAAGCPVINALSDRYHPCQGLADLFTVWERPGGLAGKRIAYIGDGNNVCHSLMHAATILGVDITVITPPGYEPAGDIWEECEALARASGAVMTFSHDPGAVAGHDVVYTDVWVSMGQTDTAGKRGAFGGFAVTAELMARASQGVKGGSLFMHCLPAHRGVEVSDDVIDSPNSIVYDQAENRMHAQNALLLHLFGKAK